MILSHFSPFPHIGFRRTSGESSPSAVARIQLLADETIPVCSIRIRRKVHPTCQLPAWPTTSVSQIASGLLWQRLCNRAAISRPGKHASRY